ncbi:hypothetical protein L0337_43055 [candidate division KSB1 bacterium]|nr:hypothetical protein [candidate division KSB1 bacterium]
MKNSHEEILGSLANTLKTPAWHGKRIVLLAQGITLFQRLAYGEQRTPGFERLFEKIEGAELGGFLSFCNWLEYISPAGLLRCSS